MSDNKKGNIELKEGPFISPLLLPHFSFRRRVCVCVCVCMCACVCVHMSNNDLTMDYRLPLRKSMVGTFVNVHAYVIFCRLENGVKVIGPH